MLPPGSVSKLFGNSFDTLLDVATQEVSEIALRCLTRFDKKGN